MSADNYPNDCLYHRDALWLRLGENGEAIVGVSHFAQEQLGQVMYVDLPRVGSGIKAGSPMGTIESRKAVSDLVAPASGKVMAINTGLRGNPDLVNRSPYGEGWLMRIALSSFEQEASSLYEAAAYMATIGIKG